MVTQAERRSSTRLKLVDAALACLVESGYRDLTTTKVVQRAGLSQGALFRYYPAKNDLVIATVAHAFAQLREEFEAAFAALAASGRPTVTAALDLLVGAMEDPRYLAVLDLYTAARTDPALRAGLAPVSRAHNDRLRELAVELPMEPALDPTVLGDLLTLSTLALQGSAVQGMVNDEAVRGHDLAALLGRLTGIGQAPPDGGPRP